VGIFTKIAMQAGLLFGPYTGLVTEKLSGNYAWRVSISHFNVKTPTKIIA
jgi:hypothetical protein